MLLFLSRPPVATYHKSVSGDTVPLTDFVWKKVGLAIAKTSVDFETMET